MEIEQIANEENNQNNGSREIVSLIAGCVTASTVGVLYGVLSRYSSDVPYLADVMVAAGSSALGVGASAIANTGYKVFKES